jgi:hypothetical protein
MEKIELPAKSLDDIKKGLAQSEALEEFLNRAQMAGEDVTEKQEKNRAVRKRLLAFKQAFFPNAV